ncbi:hypothetical protein FPV67DRAFT_1667506 [Lyophyllum atratum]|nr:hypothetical protein FPV67DRAFT_1667506 [Lyophyllum atratum]
MAPRFANPHFLPDSSTLVSRSDIYVEKDDPESDEETDSPSPELVGQLNTLIRKLWEPAPEESRKRRKIQVEPATPVEEKEEPIPFRLVSSSDPPHPILLQPKPPPPPITREPEIEDNEAQAALRMERAQAAAIDVPRILRESQLFTPPIFGNARKSKLAMAVLPNPPPVIAILEHDKPSRSTRPPVIASRLTHHPYNHGPILPTDSSGKAEKADEAAGRATPTRVLEAQRRRWREEPWLCYGVPMQFRGAAKWDRYRDRLSKRYDEEFSNAILIPPPGYASLCAHSFPDAIRPRTADF